LNASARRLCWFGVVGPSLFALAVIVCGALRSEYSHVTQFISELGETGGENAALMQYAGFILPGAFIALFAIPFWRAFRSAGVLAVLVALLVAIHGVAKIAAGSFSCDLGCTPKIPSMDHVRHQQAAHVGLFALTAAAFLCVFLFKRFAAWKRLRAYTLATGIFAIIFAVAMVVSIESRSATGLFQRLFVGGLYLWLVIVALRLLRLWDAREPT